MQGTINDRIKILISALGMSARAFSHALEVSESTTRNYLDKGSKPGTDYIERIATQFSNVNLIWLITGKGEPLIDDASTDNQTNISGNKNNVATGKNGKVVQKNYNLSDCEKERDTYRDQVAQLRSQLSDKDKLIASQEITIASKEEILGLLRGGYNRPN